MKRPLLASAKRLMLAFAAPPKWLFTSITIALMLPFYSYALYRDMNAWLAMFLILGLQACWKLYFVRLLSFGGMALFAKREFPELDKRWRRWLIFPVTFGLSYLLVQYEVPFHLAFNYSRPAMTSLVQQVQRAKPKTRFPDQRVGFFTATHIAKSGPDVYFAIDPDLSLAGRYHGFAYSANGSTQPPTQLPETAANLYDSYDKLDEHWLYVRSSEDW